MSRTAFVQSCVLCGDHRKFLHNPKLIGCPTCGTPYCKKCYAKLPKVKVGLIRKQRQCVRCAGQSGKARMPYAQVELVPANNELPQPAPVKEKETIITEIVKVRCPYCKSLHLKTEQCQSCGA